MKISDRRVKKTEKAIKTAFAELLAEKEIHNITVRELTDRADIHRATFYAHYQDIYDLYEQLENDIIEEISSIIVKTPTHTYDEIYRTIINYITENPALCKILTGNTENRTFRSRISAILETSYMNIWLYEENLTEITEEMRYLTAYHISGCLAIINRWADNRFADSKERIIELIQKVNDNIDTIT